MKRRRKQEWGNHTEERKDRGEEMKVDLHSWTPTMYSGKVAC